ncbi:hypothetical protein FRB94_000295 [Tulasnella sp. JGI-2019a]|nr:hypothetical protein FRB93_003216 [Tulasnella sp. JGI-2019a]KAG9006884.1 hypothetical protein FRB94_000295 [Tulasnella sp. JGI-2019a]
MSHTYNAKLSTNDLGPPRDSDSPNAFSDAGNYWAQYNKSANGFEDGMMKRLNSNLDTLLIVDGLFSAVDTAFTIVALDALSAYPVDQTAHYGPENALKSSKLIAPYSESRSAGNCLLSLSSSQSATANGVDKLLEGCRSSRSLTEGNMGIWG